MSGINAEQLLRQIIRPILSTITMWSESAENLLMGTAAQESQLGFYVKQIKGPALGIFQMEPYTYADILATVVMRAQKHSIFLQSYTFPDDPRALIYDLRLATIMCRLQYWRFSEELPASTDVIGLASYWKQYYNSRKGKGTVEEFIENYKITGRN